MFAGAAGAAESCQKATDPKNLAGVKLFGPPDARIAPRSGRAAGWRAGRAGVSDQ